MECNIKQCLWNAFDQCCPESEEQFDNAIPDTVDCPSYIDELIERQLFKLYEDCKEMLSKRSREELLDIKKFIESQRT